MVEWWLRGRSQDGGGVGRAEHSLPHKYIKKAFKRGVNSKTTSECRQRTSGTQKSNPTLRKGGRKKYERQKKRQKREGWNSVPGRES